MFFQNRRKYVHVGSRATSLLHSVLKKHSRAYASVVKLPQGKARKSVARQDAAVRRIGLQAILWMAQPALAPVGSVF
jgi:hypothetical protein